MHKKGTMKEVEKYFYLSNNQLKQAEEKLAKKNVTLASVANYAINVFQSPVPRSSMVPCLLEL